MKYCQMPKNASMDHKSNFYIVKNSIIETVLLLRKL